MIMDTWHFVAFVSAYLILALIVLVGIALFYIAVMIVNKTLKFIEGRIYRNEKNNHTKSI